MRDGEDACLFGVDAHALLVALLLAHLLALPTPRPQPSASQERAEFGFISCSKLQVLFSWHRSLPSAVEKRPARAENSARASRGRPRAAPDAGARPQRPVASAHSEPSADSRAEADCRGVAAARRW